jgi:hypothetical protein
MDRMSSDTRGRSHDGLLWFHPLDAALLGGVSIYGVQKRDKTIYLACLGSIVLEAAVVTGVLVHG